eukprot:3941286-Rhodomonas_salina.1
MESQEERFRPDINPNSDKILEQVSAVPLARYAPRGTERSYGAMRSAVRRWRVVLCEARYTVLWAGVLWALRGTDLACTEQSEKFAGKDFYDRQVRPRLCVRFGATRFADGRSGLRLRACDLGLAIQGLGLRG